MHYKHQVSSGFARVARVMGQPSFAGFLYLPVFLLTRTGPATGSTRRASPGLITMLSNLKYYISSRDKIDNM